MNGSRHGAGNGSFGKSTADAALRGALLVGVAVIIGALLLWKAHDDNATASVDTTGGTPTTVAPTSSVPRATTTAPQGGATTTAPQGAATTAPAAAVHPPAEVKVLVANGTGTPTGASTVSNKLKPKGYNVLAAADANSATIQASKIYYRAGYAEDAKQIARDLGVAAPVEGIIEAMPATPPVKANAAQRATDANVLVLLGTDLKIKQT
jgi:LytR cell envelope-related transcriptional attenuator